MAEATSTPGGDSGGGNQSRLIVIFGSLIVLALVGVIVALVLNLNRPVEQTLQEEEPRQRSVLITEENVEAIVEEAEEAPATPVGSYEATMNMTWNFPDGSSPSSNAYVENTESNINDVYFDLQMRDTGETLYESPVIPVGQRLTGDQITLNRDLNAGTYRCVVVYHLVDDAQRTLATLNMGVTVIVEG